MNILSKEQVEYKRNEIKHYQESKLNLVHMKPSENISQETIDEQIASLDYKIRCRWDDIELTQALLSINIAHCKAVGLRFANLCASIQRNIGK